MGQSSTQQAVMGSKAESVTPVGCHCMKSFGMQQRAQRGHHWSHGSAACSASSTSSCSRMVGETQAVTGDLARDGSTRLPSCTLQRQGPSLSSARTRGTRGSEVARVGADSATSRLCVRLTHGFEQSRCSNACCPTRGVGLTAAGCAPPRWRRRLGLGCSSRRSSGTRASEWPQRRRRLG